MNYQQVFEKLQKKISTTPTKLPDAQIKWQLKQCKDLISINNLLRYCAYQNEDSFIPSQAMAEVMTKRLLLLVKQSPSLDKKGWLQIQNCVHYIRGHVTRARGKWHITFVLITLENRLSSKEDSRRTKFTSSSDGIEVQYSEAKGRHIIASRDMESGQMICVDKDPLAFIIFDPKSKESKVVICVQCGKSSICSFPCPRCPDVVFCSIVCMRQALTTHHLYECVPMRLYALLSVQIVVSEQQFNIHISNCKLMQMTTVAR